MRFSYICISDVCILYLDTGILWDAVVGIAAPLFSGGHVVGSVGVYLPKIRYDEGDGMLEKVLDTARAINDKIEQTERMRGVDRL